MVGSLVAHVWFASGSCGSLLIHCDSLLVHSWFIGGSCVVRWWFVAGSLCVAVGVAVDSLLFASGSLVVLLTLVDFCSLLVPS